jgi:hypothetical protein
VDRHHSDDDLTHRDRRGLDARRSVYEKLAGSEHRYADAAADPSVVRRQTKDQPDLRIARPVSIMLD